MYPENIKGDFERMCVCVCVCVCVGGGGGGGQKPIYCANKIKQYVAKCSVGNTSSTNKHRIDADLCSILQYILLHYVSSCLNLPCK